MSVTETLGKAFTRIFKTSSERYVRKRGDFVDQVNTLEAEFGLL